MPDRPDYLALIQGQTSVLDRINSGEAGLGALNELMQVAQTALRARGASFAEYGPGHGRIIAASGAGAWALGRPVDRGDSRLGEGPRVDVVGLDSVNPELSGHLRGRGLSRILSAPCEVGGLVVGSLHVYYNDADGPPGDEHHAVLSLLASYVAHLYGDQCGLPVHGDGPGAAALSDGLAIVDRLHEDRDLFVAVTSHELRTPVTVIKGYADTLTNHWNSLDEPGRREAVRIIGARAGELARLVDRLLSAASDAGPVGEPAPGPFDLAEALQAAVADLPADLRRRLVVHRFPADLPKAYGDRNSLATILTELATNADKYSPAGTDVELCAGADEQTVTFRVSDRGVGIRPEHVERAFERYWQGESGDRRHYPGAGLGLYLVRRIVERQHGWVFLRPRDGGGTVAEVRLPGVDS